MNGKIYATMMVNPWDSNIKKADIVRLLSPNLTMNLTYLCYGSSKSKARGCFGNKLLDETPVNWVNGSGRGLNAREFRKRTTGNYGNP